MKTNSGFTLVGAFIVMVAAAVFVASVCYIAIHMIDKAKTIEAHRRQQLTNELVEPFPANFPAEPEWILDLSEVDAAIVGEDGQLVIEIPDAAASNLFASVGAYRIEYGPSMDGPWSGGDYLTGTVHSVRSMLLGLLRAQAASCPFPSKGFYRMIKE